MKTVFRASALIAFVLLTTAVQAQVTATIDLEVTGGIQGKHHSVKRGGMSCKGGPGPVYFDGFRDIRAPLRYETDKDHVQRSGIRIDKNGDFPYTLSAHTSITSTNQTYRARLELTEVAVKHYERGWREGCEHNHFNQYLQSAGYHGKAVFRHQVSPGTWAIRITESKPNDVFRASSRKPFEYGLMSLTSKQDQVLWVKPGSVIQRTVEVNASANAIRGVASYEIAFEEVGAPLDAAAIQSLLMKGEFIEQVQQNLGPKPAQVFWMTALSMIRSHDALTAALRTLPLKRLNEIAQGLSHIALIQALGKDSDLAASVKTSAALLSYEVASLFTEEMAPYCDKRDVSLPYTGEQVNILGARYASFLLNKLSARLDANILVTHQSFIDKLVELRKKGYTYAMVSRDESTRQRLEISFDIVREVTQPWRRPFVQARQDLVDFYKVFPSSGVGRNSAAAVLDLMQGLAKKEDEYLAALFDHVDLYSRTNTMPIDTANLERLIGELKVILADVKEALNSQGRFLTVDGDVKLDSLMGTLMSLKSDNFAVVSRAYENVRFDFPFENVRNAYVDTDRMTRNLQTIEACAHDGLK